jgi:O-antigen/teichoic acid export membrane protein
LPITATLSAVVCLLFVRSIMSGDEEPHATNRGEVSRRERRHFFINQVTLLAGELSLTLCLTVATSSAVLGLYRAADRLASAISFPLIATNSITMPQIAKAVAGNDVKAVKRIANAGARFSAMVVVPATGLTLLLGPYVLTHAFGPEFEGAYKFLVALSTGYVVSALTGPSFATLSMSGHQSDVVIVNVVTAAALAAAVCILGWVGSIVGVAVAVGAIISAQNLLGALLVRHRLGFWCVPTLRKGL